MIQIQISEEFYEKLMQMVKEGNEVHIEFTPDETRIDVMPWKPFDYKCPYHEVKQDAELS